MQSNDIEIIKGNGLERVITNPTRLVQYVGLDSVTILEKTQKPFFFLFIDLDSKDEESLRDVLNICRFNHLTVYFYETCKGWHIISPCLLNIRKWAAIHRQLEKYQNYSGDTIRWTPRHCDGKLLFYQSWNNMKRQYLESYDLHFKLREKFMVNFRDLILDEHFVSSSLEWNIYNQLRLKKIRHF